MKKTLVISAGGKNTRIRKFLNDSHGGKPKHTLYLPTKGSCACLGLIDRIIIEAESFFDRIIVEASVQNNVLLNTLFFRHLSTEVVVDTICSGPLGPPIRKLLAESQRVYSCAGDHFHPLFDWEAFERFHEAHHRPISILVSHSVPMPKGATFNLSPNGKITSWERVSHSRSADLINIGCYIMDPDPRILEALRGMTIHKEDVFFDLFIRQGLVYGYNPGGLGFNINTADTYMELLRHGPY